MNQSQLAHSLTDQGLKYDRQEVNIYYERGKIPKPDLRVSGTKYWSRSTARSLWNKKSNVSSKTCGMALEKSLFRTSLCLYAGCSLVKQFAIFLNKSLRTVSIYVKVER